MGKEYFPMFLDISGLKIFIAGGGKIAARRIKTLLLFAQDITVAAPEACPEIEELAEAGRITWLAEEYSAGLLGGAELVLAATDDHEVNRRIVEDCRKLEQKENRRILVNTADDKSLCDFYFPSVVQDGEIVIGINSGGTNPGKVSRVRKKIEEISDSW